MQDLARIKDFFRGNKKTYVLGIFWLLAVDTIQLVSPKLLEHLTDDFQSGIMNGRKLIIYVLIVFGVGVFSGVARYYWRIYISGNSAKLDYTLRKDFFSHYLTYRSIFSIPIKQET